ncbi:MAG: hypothetical protein EA368_06005 [Leptolyngbya sp. DLM2.Bin27]|nr:MAG: hypothetical protein EA368_06005 [Leptolyngbya sp. DLM2.Bin27]
MDGCRRLASSNQSKFLTQQNATELRYRLVTLCDRKIAELELKNFDQGLKFLVFIKLAANGMNISNQGLVSRIGNKNEEPMKV